MEQSTLVKIRATDQCLTFRTVSRVRKSPHTFYILRSRLEQLKDSSDPVVIASDSASFAELRRDAASGVVDIRFSWLNRSYDHLDGWAERVIIDDTPFIRFLHNAAEGEQICLLSQKEHILPKMIFYEGRSIREVVANNLVRKKLARFLRDQFQWRTGGTICFYSDRVPYSFFFEETRNGQAGICGGLILHGQEDMSRAYYSVHT